MKEYQGSKSNSYCIESLFKYLYLIDVLEEKRKFAELYGDREKIRRHFNRLKNEDIKQDKMQKESVATLSFTQIEKLIEYYNEVEPAIDFSSYKKLRMAFAFYTLFFQGISVNGLRHMNMENYSEDTLMIDGRLIIVPEKFRSMFKYAKEKETRENDMVMVIEEKVENGVVTNGGNLFLLAKSEKILILANRISIMDTYY